MSQFFGQWTLISKTINPEIFSQLSNVQCACGLLQFYMNYKIYIHTPCDIRILKSCWGQGFSFILFSYANVVMMLIVDTN